MCIASETILVEKPVAAVQPNSILLDPVTSDMQHHQMQHHRKCSSGFVNNAKESLDLQVSQTRPFLYKNFVPKHIYTILMV